MRSWIPGSLKRNQDWGVYLSMGFTSNDPLRQLGSAWRLALHLIAILLVALLQACSEDEPTGPLSQTEDQPEVPGDLHVASVSDTLCRHYDTVVLHGHGFGAEPSEITVFFGFTWIPVYAVSENTVTVIVPRIFFPARGVLRLYRGEKLATGRFVFTIIPVDPSVSSWGVNYHNYFCYEDEAFIVTGQNLHALPREIDLRIGKVKVQIESIDPSRIFAKVPAGATTDTLRVTFDGETRIVGTMKVLSRTDDLLNESRLRVFELSAHGLRGSVRLTKTDLNGSTTVSTSQLQQEVRTTHDGRHTGAFVFVKGDSILYSDSDPLGAFDTLVQTCEFRLKQSKPDCTISGVIRIGVRSKPGFGDHFTSWEFVIENLPYKRWLWQQSSAIAEGEAMKSVVRSVKVSNRRFVDGNWVSEETIDYTPGGSEFWVSFAFN